MAAEFFSLRASNTPRRNIRSIQNVALGDSKISGPQTRTTTLQSTSITPYKPITLSRPTNQLSTSCQYIFKQTPFRSCLLNSTTRKRIANAGKDSFLQYIKEEGNSKNHFPNTVHYQNFFFISS